MIIALYCALVLLKMPMAANQENPTNRGMVRAEANVRCDCYARVATAARRIQRRITGAGANRKRRNYVTPRLTFTYDLEACYNDRRSARLRAHIAGLSGAERIAFEQAVNERLSRRCSRQTARLKSIKLN